ncbi:hypothetical protein KAJ89_00830 [Candidatus Parcubacteria bacterium]|nr:hypothetical protein [Candidatus Parcubacteria bacterium]
MGENIVDMQKIRMDKLLSGRGELSDFEKKMILVYDNLAMFGINLNDMSNEVMDRKDEYLALRTRPLVELFIKINEKLNDLIEYQFDCIELIPNEEIEIIEEI